MNRIISMNHSRRYEAELSASIPAQAERSLAILNEYKSRFGGDAARKLYAECGNTAAFVQFATADLEAADYSDAARDERPF